MANYNNPRQDNTNPSRGTNVSNRQQQTGNKPFTVDKKQKGKKQQ